MEAKMSNSGQSPPTNIMWVKFLRDTYWLQTLAMEFNLLEPFFRTLDQTNVSHTPISSYLWKGQQSLICWKLFSIMFSKIIPNIIIIIFKVNTQVNLLRRDLNQPSLEKLSKVNNDNWSNHTKSSSVQSKHICLIIQNYTTYLLFTTSSLFKSEKVKMATNPRVDRKLCACSSTMKLCNLLEITYVISR